MAPVTENMTKTRHALGGYVVKSGSMAWTSGPPVLLLQLPIIAQQECQGTGRVDSDQLDAPRAATNDSSCSEALTTLSLRRF